MKVMQHSIMLKIGIFWHGFDISVNVHSPQVVSSNNELALIFQCSKLRHRVHLCGLNDKTFEGCMNYPLLSLSLVFIFHLEICIYIYICLHPVPGTLSVNSVRKCHKYISQVQVLAVTNHRVELLSAFVLFPV